MFKTALQKKPVALQNLDPHQVTFVGFSRRFLAPHNFLPHFVKFHIQYKRTLLLEEY